MVGHLRSPPRACAYLPVLGPLVRIKAHGRVWVWHELQEQHERTDHEPAPPLARLAVDHDHVLGVAAKPGVLHREDNARVLGFWGLRGTYIWEDDAMRSKKGGPVKMI
jgi:hypothetical protein